MAMPLVLLPGTLCDATLFAHQVQNLGDVTDPQVIPVHLQDHLSDVARYVLTRVSGEFAVAGLSYGGIVALEIWRQAPERVRKLALLNTNPYEASPETRASQRQFVGMAHLGEFREVTTDFLKDLMLHPDHQTDQDLRARVLQMAETIGIDGFINEVKAQLNRPSSIVDLPNIKCPTLVLTGREDTIVPVRVHEAMVQRLPNSRLVIIEHCGHLSTMEQPEIVTSHLRQWITGTGIWKENIA